MTRDPNEASIPKRWSPPMGGDLPDPPALVSIADAATTATSSSSRAFLRGLEPRDEATYARMILELRAGRCSNGASKRPTSIRCVGDAVRILRFTQKPEAGAGPLPDIEMDAATLEWWSDRSTSCTTLNTGTMRAGTATAAAFAAAMLEAPALDGDGCERVRGTLGAIAAASAGPTGPRHALIATAGTPWSPTTIRHVVPDAKGGPFTSTLTTTWDEALEGVRAPRVVRVWRETAKDGSGDVVRIAPYVLLLDGDEIPDPVETLRILASLRTSVT